METETLKSIDKTLKAILSILVADRPDNPLKLREQVLRLHTLGLRPKEISEIVGRSNTYVSKELSQMRKLKKERTSSDGKKKK